MLAALIDCQIHSWRKWEDQAHMDRHDVLTGKLSSFVAGISVILLLLTRINNCLMHMALRKLEINMNVLCG